jgi:FkbM family methyltransferase
MLKIEENAPIWYRLVVKLPVGRYRTLNYLKKQHKLDRIAKFPFYNGTAAVPLSIFPMNLSKYQYIRISEFAQVCNDRLGSFDFIDCGAHLGLFSAQFSILSGQVRQLIAIEPNPVFFELLKTNIANARADEISCLNAAISDFEGRGRLVDPDRSPYPSTSAYVVNDPDGGIEVVTLASILRDRARSRVAIKLDVEGAELPALQSSADQLRSLEGVVLFLEVHEGVLARIGMSDVEMMSEIEGIRSFEWINSSDGARIDPRRPILPQTNLSTQCDLIGISTS